MNLKTTIEWKKKVGPKHKGRMEERNSKKHRRKLYPTCKIS